MFVIIPIPCRAHLEQFVLPKICARSWTWPCRLPAFQDCDEPIAWALPCFCPVLKLDLDRRKWKTHPVFLFSFPTSAVGCQLPVFLSLHPLLSAVLSMSEVCRNKVPGNRCWNSWEDVQKNEFGWKIYSQHLWKIDFQCFRRKSSINTSLLSGKF